MNKVFVHLHLYYQDQLDYFIEKLGNISGVDWDLTVTYSSLEEEAINKLRNFKPDVVFKKVENIGYDIWPFIYALKGIDLDSYDFVVKLHTKRAVRKCSVNVIPLKGLEWRNALVDGILHSPRYFKNVINRLNSDDNIGMISNLLTYSKRNWPTYLPGIEKEMKRLGLECKGEYFCMGTMFIARSEVLKPLQSDLITSETFADTLNDKERDFKSAHYYERLISVLPYSFGMKHVTACPKKSDEVKIKLVRFAETPFRWIFSIEKKGPQKRKFMRIFGIEFYIEKQKDSKQLEFS